MTADEILAGARVMVLEPGDVLVVECPDFIDKYRADFLKQRIAEYLPGHECLVLGGGIKLHVARP